MQKEKEALAAIMLEHGIEWEQKGEHKEHLSVLEFKREKRKEEIAELEQTLERVQQKQVSVQAVEQIEAKPLPLTSKVAVEREDYAIASQSVICFGLCSKTGIKFLLMYSASNVVDFFPSKTD